MARFLALCSIFFIMAVGSCLAEAPRFRQRQRLQPHQRQRFFARQQLAPAMGTPYPTAQEIVPDVPFTEESASPEQVYGPPELTYGPPAGSSAQLPSAGSPQQFEANPDAEEFLLSDAAPARLTQAPNRTARTKAIARLQKSQRLIATPSVPAVATVPAVPASAPIFAASPIAFNLAPALAQQYYVVNQPFAYSAQFQSW